MCSPFYCLSFSKDRADICLRTWSIKWPSFSFPILAIISVCHLLCLNAWLLASALYGLETNTAFEDCFFLKQYIKLGALASTCNCARTWTFCCNLELLHTRLLEDAGRTQGQASSTQWYSGRHNLHTKSLPARSFLCEEAADCQARHALGVRLKDTLHGKVQQTLTSHSSSPSEKAC